MRAHHEAGHFVANLERGGHPYSVTIEVGRDGSGGAVHGEAGLGLKPSLQAVRELVAELFAGHAAACHFEPRFVRFSKLTASDDDRQARAYMHLFPRVKAGVCRRMAAELVARRWTEIHAIAVLLLERTSIPGEEAEIVADVAAGRTPAEGLAAYRKMLAHLRDG